ncbi:MULTISPECIES: phage holin [Staphylococcus]|jgi:SPP1 family holin|uniref:phage holin n=1 Tax=Staphylococcus TaxID=1279 RepID=UPI001F56D4C5|nr:phage holin [Staphylococcus hominis]MCI2924815.1 phage holin [Staphylococcus hominis]
MEVKVIVRYIVLIMAIVNQFLANRGLSPIPVDEETISTIALAVIGLYTAWKDNPTSKEGQWANKKLKKYKAEKKYRQATGQAPTKEYIEPSDLDELG